MVMTYSARLRSSSPRGLLPRFRSHEPEAASRSRRRRRRWPRPRLLSPAQHGGRAAGGVVVFHGVLTSQPERLSRRRGQDRGISTGPYWPAATSQEATDARISTPMTRAPRGPSSAARRKRERTTTGPRPAKVMSFSSRSIRVSWHPLATARGMLAEITPSTGLSDRVAPAAPVRPRNGARWCA